MDFVSIYQSGAMHLETVLPIIELECAFFLGLDQAFPSGAVLISTVTFAEHLLCFPWCCGVFVYKLETSIDTEVESLPLFSI